MPNISTEKIMCSPPIMLTLNLLAPYLAVSIFWCLLHNGWLAILAYHCQILFWQRRSPSKIGCKTLSRHCLLVLPFSLTGLVAYLLLPRIPGVDLHLWLDTHHLSRASLLLMIPYFGLLHPPLEQLHWSPLRDRTPLAHLLFAGYHVIVLYSLLPMVWLLAVFVGLACASCVWQAMEKRSGGLLTPMLAHVLADFAIMVAALLLS